MPTATTSSDGTVCMSSSRPRSGRSPTATGRSSPVRADERGDGRDRRRWRRRPGRVCSTPEERHRLVPSPSSTTAKKTDSLMPRASMQMTVTTTAARSTGVAQQVPDAGGGLGAQAARARWRSGFGSSTCGSRAARPRRRGRSRRRAARRAGRRARRRAPAPASRATSRSASRTVAERAVGLTELVLLGASCAGSADRADPKSDQRGAVAARRRGRSARGPRGRARAAGAARRRPSRRRSTIITVPAAEAVDQDAAERRQQGRQGEHGEDAAGDAVGAGELLGPHARAPAASPCRRTSTASARRAAAGSRGAAAGHASGRRPRAGAVAGRWVAARRGSPRAGTRRRTCAPAGRPGDVLLPGRASAR